MEPRDTGLDRRGEAWGDFENPDAPRPTVQELFARTRRGLATPRQGRVRRPDAIGFAVDRRGFWLLCAGGVITVLLVFLAGFLAGVGTNLDPPDTAVAPIAAAPQPGDSGAGGPARPFDPPLPAPAPAVDPRLAELGPAPLPTNAIPAVPTEPPAQPMLSPLAVQGVVPAPANEDAAPAEASPPPAASAPVPLVQAAPPPAPAPAPAPAATQAAPAPAPSPPPPAITAPPTASGDWVLQFGAFRGRENAERLAASLRGRVDGVRVQSASGPGGTALFHVWAGAFPDRDAAAAEAARLKAAHGLDAFATRP